jgi:hypothetical protein
MIVCSFFSFCCYELIQNYYSYFALANNVWFERFRQQLTTMRNEYLALSSHCLEGGEAATIDFILNRHVIKIIFLTRKISPLFSALFSGLRIK